MGGHEIYVIHPSGQWHEDNVDILRRNAFNGDGAIVIDGRSGKVISCGWFVSDISSGGSNGGARSRSAKAVAQQAGGCFVIKCSEDSHGEVTLHLGSQTCEFRSKL